MPVMRSASATSPRTPPGRAIVAAILAGAIGWIGVVWIGLQLADQKAANLGFDLELLLGAGRDVAAGRSPYAADLLAGGAPLATSLFYSYPPPVAQVFSVLAGVPSRLALVLWVLGAVAAFLVVTELLRRRLAPQRPARQVLLAAAACLPLTLPFAVGVLFGNLDIWFPFLYGAMLLAVVAPERATAISAGAGLAAASLKLHPASIGVWFLARAVRDQDVGRRKTWLLVVVTAAVAVVVVVVLSLVLGGTRPWLDYVEVVRAGAGAAIVDPRNAGIAAQVAGVFGGGDGLARSLHVVVGAAAVLVTVWAAWRRSDPVESFAWAAAASLATLPVTWYHYPSAMIPIAVAAILRASGETARSVALLITAGAVVAAVALVWLPLLWVAIGLIVTAARVSGAGSSTSSMAPVRATG
jgi:hypothetical protein